MKSREQILQQAYRKGFEKGASVKYIKVLRQLAPRADLRGVNRSQRL